jgi:hypothetical protein
MKMIEVIKNIGILLAYIVFFVLFISAVLNYMTTDPKRKLNKK